MKFFRKFKNSMISQTVILAIIFGFAAGMVGQIMADVYVDPFQDELLRQALFFNQAIDPIIPELRRASKFLGIEQDFQVDRAINQIRPSLAGIFPVKTTLANKQNISYQPNELVASAFVLTSDGWLATSQDIGARAPINMVVVHQSKQYEIERVVADSSSNVTFVKVNAQNLRVVTLGDSAAVKLGQLMLTLNSFDQARVTTIQAKSALVDSAVDNQLEWINIYICHYLSHHSGSKPKNYGQDNGL